MSGSEMKEPSAKNQSSRSSEGETPFRRTAQVERDAAAAIAEIETASLLDALDPDAGLTKTTPTDVREAPSATPADPSTSATAAGDRPSHDFGALASSVNEAFKGFSIADGEWFVELSAPHVASTGSSGGGPESRPALQHLRLRPRQRREGTATIVAGTVNPIDNRAELRDYDHVAIAHEVRHRQPIQIRADEWEKLLRKAELVLNASDIQSLRTPPTRELLDQRRSMQRISKRAITILIVVLVLATVVAWRVALTLVFRP
jgi:hypothetical protein